MLNLIAVSSFLSGQSWPSDAFVSWLLKFLISASVINLFSFYNLNRCWNGEDFIISLRQLAAVEMERAKLE